MTTPLSVLGATIDYSDPNDPEIRIKWSAVKNFLNWSTPPTSANASLDPWFASCLQGLALWNDSVSTTNHNLVVDLPSPGIQPRNNIDNRLTSSYNATVFALNAVSATIDADNLIA